MLRENPPTGFEHAELSHGIRLSLVPGILQAVDEESSAITTLHNFCPLPSLEPRRPNVFQFTSLDRKSARTPCATRSRPSSSPSG